MTKAKTSSYILTLPLKTEKFQEDILNKRFNIARQIYNSCLGEILKRYNHMKESKEYQKIFKLPKGKERNKQFNNLNKKYSVNEYSLHEFVKLMCKHFKSNIDSLTAQKLASRAFNSFEKLMFHEAKKVYFIKYNELQSIEGKWNKSGIKYNIKNNYLVWNGLNISAVLKPNDIYAKMALKNRIKYCRIKREIIKNKYKYYVQLILEGIPPVKIDRHTGEIKGQIGQGKVGIDIGTRTIAISSKYDVKLLELAPEINNIEGIKTKLQRKLDRQRRANNPNKYNKDGTIKRNNKDEWIKSKNYIKTQNKLKDIQRKLVATRKQSHNILANCLLKLGNEFYVETMNYKGLQVRAKKTTKNKNGKFNKKKRFGKSLAYAGPSMFLTILDNKLKWNGTELKKINTYKVKASQYNHFADSYNKKELKDRWNNDIGIQRDLYSAFLIMNVNSDLESINTDKCISEYDNFKILHDKEIERLEKLKLSGIKLISSMGI